jgi:cytoskeletal protein CcmA (bactofilin family)
MKISRERDRIHADERGTDDRRESDTIVAQGTRFKGNAHVEGDLWIGGIVLGEVVCSDTLRVAQDSDVQANLRARDVVIAGEVRGDVQAENRVTLQSTAQVQGKLRAVVLVVEEGAALRAACDIGRNTLSFSLPARPIPGIASGDVA